MSAYEGLDDEGAPGAGEDAGDEQPTASAITLVDISAREAIAILANNQRLPTFDSVLAHRRALAMNLAKIRKYEKLDGVPGAVAFSHDGKFLAIAGDAFVALIEASSGNVLRSDCGTKAVNCLAFSPDDSILALGEVGGRVALHDVQTGELLHSAVRRAAEGRQDEFEDCTREADVCTIAFSPDGSLLAVVGGSCSPALLSSITCVVALEVKLAGYEDNFVSSTSVCFAPDGGHFAVGQEFGQVSAIDSRSGEVVWRVQMPSPVSSLAYSADGLRLAAAATLGEAVISLMDALTGEACSQLPSNSRLLAQEATADGTDNSFYALAFSPDGARLAGGYGIDGELGGVAVMDSDCGDLLFELPLPDVAHSLFFSPDGARLAIVCANNAVAWVVDAQLYETQLTACAGRSADSLAWEPSGVHLAVSHYDLGLISIVDAATGTEVSSFEMRATALAFSPVGCSLAVAQEADSEADAGPGLTLVALDGQALVDFAPFAQSFGTICALAFAPDGRKLVVGDEKGAIAVLDARTDEQIATDAAEAKQRALLDLGDELGSANRSGAEALSAVPPAQVDRSAALVRTYTRSMESERRPVCALAWSADSSRIAYGTDHVGVLNAANGVRMLELSRKCGSNQVAFSPDSSQLLVAGDVGRAAVYDSASGALLLDMSTKHNTLDECCTLAWAPARMTARDSETSAGGDGFIALPVNVRSEHKTRIARLFSANGRPLWDVALARDKAAQTSVNTLALSSRSGTLALALSDCVLLVNAPTVREVVVLEHGQKRRTRMKRAGVESSEPLRELLAMCPAILAIVGRDGRTLIEVLIEREKSAWLEVLLRTTVHVRIDEGSFALALNKGDARALHVLFVLATRDAGTFSPLGSRVAAARAIQSAVESGAKKVVGDFLASLSLEQMGEPFYFEFQAEGGAHHEEHDSHDASEEAVQWPLSCASEHAGVPVQWRKSAVSQQGPHTVKVVAQRVRLPLLGTGAILLALSQCQHEALWSSVSVSATLGPIWNEHIKRYHYGVCALLLGEVLCFALVATATVERELHPLGLAIAYFGIFGASSFLLWLEARQYYQALAGLKMKGTQLNLVNRVRVISRKYASVWDASDVISQLLLLICALADLVQLPRDYRLQMLAFAGPALMVKVLSALRGFEEIAHFVQVLLQSFLDMRALLAVCMLLVLFGGLTFYCLFGTVPLPMSIDGLDPVPDQDSFVGLMRSPWTALGASFSMGLLGAFSTDSFDQTASPLYTWLVFVSFMLALMVVALNALIALLGDTYARVQGQAQATRNAQLAQLLIEYFDIIGESARTRIEQQTLWSHQLVPLSSLDEDELSTENEWHGRLAELQLTIKREVHHSRTAVEAKLQAVSRDVRAVQSEIVSTRSATAAVRTTENASAAHTELIRAVLCSELADMQRQIQTQIREFCTRCSGEPGLAHWPAHALSRRWRGSTTRRRASSCRLPRRHRRRARVGRARRGRQIG